jgi:uncharacterized protein
MKGGTKYFAVAVFTMLFGLLGLFVVGPTQSQAPNTKEPPNKHKIAYHLSDPEKTKFVLSNIQNHINGVGGWGHIEALELVVIGPALKNFVTKTMDPEIQQALERLQSQGVVFGACGNTMKAFNINLEQLPAKTEFLPQGGGVRLMDLQEQGYVYIRP